MDKFDKVVEYLESLEENDLMTIHKAYCEANNYYDDEVFYMYELNDLFCGCTPIEVLEKCQGSDFDVNDNYFKFTIWGVESEAYLEDLVEMDELAEYICKNDESFGRNDIREILDEEDEEDEEEDGE